MSLGNAGPGRDPEEVLAELTERTKRNTADRQRRKGVSGRENSRCKSVRRENMAHPGNYYYRVSDQ